MNVVPLGELMPSRIPTINPGAFPDEQFTLWSIPSYDAGKPEHVAGRDVGSSKKAVQDGDVLLSKIVPHIRRAWKVSVSNGHRQIASSEWITFRHDAFLSDYIRHFLLTDQFHRQFMDTVAGVGGSLLRAQPKSVAKIGIPLPPVDEQRRIVGLLDRAAEIRRRADADRAKARAIIPALFLETFGDPATNPKGWPMVGLKELCRPRQWKTITASELTEAGFPVYGANGVIGLYSEFNHAGPVIAVTCRGATCGTINVTVPRAYVTGNAMCLDELSSDVELHFLASALSRRGFGDIITGAAQPQITGQSLTVVEVPVPPLALQTAFTVKVRQIESLARRLDAAAAKAEAMAAALSAEMFG